VRSTDSSSSWRSGAACVADLVSLVRAAILHATVVLQEIARCWPAETDDRGNDPIVYHNLASLWSNYASRGARLLVEQILQDRSELRALRDAIPGAAITVVRLRAELRLIEERLREREPCPEDELSAARWLMPRMEQWAIEDCVVENDRRPLREVAREVLGCARWMS